MKTILDDLISQENTVRDLGCKVGRSYDSIAKYKQENKSKFPKINSYGFQLALELFEKTGKTASYTSIENGVLIQVKIERIS